MRSVKKSCRSLALVLFVGGVILSAAAAQAEEPLFARMETGAGDILLVFYPELAPHHVGNFVHLSRTGFYAGTKFHRIVPGFIIQGGDPNSKDADPRNDGLGGPKISDVLTPADMEMLVQIDEMLEAKGYQPIDVSINLKNEFSQTAKHVRGTLSMARSPQGDDTAGSQFFICVDTRAQLDGQYTIFGHVVAGMDVVDAIVNAEKNPSAGRDAPRSPVAIKQVTVFEGLDGLKDVEKAAWEGLPANLQTGK